MKQEFPLPSSVEMNLWFLQERERQNAKHRSNRLSRQLQVHDGDTVWRAITHFRHPENGETFEHIEGVYIARGPAQGRITFWKRHGYRMVDFTHANNDRTKWVFVDGHVEHGAVEWDKKTEES